MNPAGSDSSPGDRNAPAEPADGRDFPESVAAVDLGSNSFHMIVARVTAGQTAIVDRLREMVRLASGLDGERNLSREAQERALECLRRFGQRVRHMPRGSVRAVGTNTLRSAGNAEEFIAEAEAALGHPIETISGIEEARLIYQGVSRSRPARPGRRLVIDIGGGSTEVIIGESEEPISMDSLYMGCVSMSRAHFEDGTLGRDRWEAAELDARREFEPIEARYRELGWENAIGASGTIRAVEGVVRAAGWSRAGITPKSLHRLKEAILQAGSLKRLRLDGLSAARRPVFAGGVVVLTAAFEALKITRMDVSEGALREGLLYDLLGRIRHEDVRDRSVAVLAARYHADGAHGGRVARTAAALREQVAEEWKLGDRELGYLLSWAAELHEIGLDVAHSHFHRHGEYIVGASDLMGFSRDEQRWLAALVRAHRRKFPVAELRALPGKRARQIERLCVLLRVAVILHRSRSPELPPAPALHVEKKSIRLVFEEHWLARHPLTRADLEQEALYLKSAGYQLEFA